MDKVAPYNAVMQNVLYEVDAYNPDTRIRTIFWLFEAAKLFWKRIASVRLDGFKADNCAFVKTAQYISLNEDNFPMISTELLVAAAVNS